MIRRSLAVVVAVVFAAAGLWWWQAGSQGPTSQSSTPVEAPTTVVSGSQPASTVAAPVVPASPAARLELGIELYAAGPDDAVVAVVRMFDADARQAEAIRAATGGRWKGSASAVAPGPVSLPQGWGDRVQLTRSGGGAVAIRERVSGPDEAVRLVVAALPPGTLLAASLTVSGLEIRSNDIGIAPPPTTRLEVAVARGRIAELLERWDALATVADELLAINERSPWGHYYQGLVARARGDAAGERAAFQRALNRIEPGEEFPRGLIP